MKQIFAILMSFAMLTCAMSTMANDLTNNEMSSETSVSTDAPASVDTELIEDAERTEITSASEDKTAENIKAVIMSETEETLPAPCVVSVSADGDNLSMVNAIKVSFDTDMDRTTLNPQNITVVNVTDGNAAPLEVTYYSAYDRSYTFLADFESMSDYEVVISTAVCSLSGAALESEVRHPFSTGTVLSSANVSPVASWTCVAGGGNTSAEKTLNKLYDGVKNFSSSSTIWYNYGVSPVWVQADLGSPKDISHVIYYLYSESSSKKAKVLASNDASFSEYTELAILPDFTSHPGRAGWIAVPENHDTKYRYIRMQTTYIDELEIFTYDIPVVVNITPGVFGETTEFVTDTAICSVEFDTDMDLETLTPDNIIVTRDSDGSVMTQTTPSRNSEAKKEAQAYSQKYIFACDFEPNTAYTITVTSNVISLAGNPMPEDVVHSFSTGPYIYNVNNITPDVPEAYTISEGSNSSAGSASSLGKLYDGVANTSPWFNYGGTSDKWITADLGEPKEIAFVACMADLPNDSEGARSANLRFEVSNDPDFEEGVVSLGKVPAITEWMGKVFWSVPSDGNAYQYVRITDNGVLYVSEFEIYEYYRDDPEILEAIERVVEDFEAVNDNASFENYITKYAYTTPFFSLKQEIPEMYEDTASHAVMGEYLLTVRPLILKEENNTMDDVISTLKGAYAWYSLCNKDESTALSVFEKYGASLGDISDISSKGAFIRLMSSLKSDITDSDKFTRAFNEAKIYSDIQDATVESTANALKNHASVLGIDLSYASGKNVTLTEVARKLDRANAVKYIDLSTASGTLLNSDYKAIVDEIYQSRLSETPSKVVTGGGGGGGGGGSLSFSKTEFAPAKTEDTQKEDSKPSANVNFTDIDDVPWAKEQIELLASKGILAGKGDSTFAPSDSVKREEVAKMLYLAFSFEDAKTSGKVFSDCDISAWYYPYVTAMNNAGIIKGYSDTEFGTGHAITRQDFALMLYRILTVNYKIFAEPSDMFADSDKIADYAKDAVLSMAAAGIINGYPDGIVAPMDKVSRAQAAVMICNAIDYIDKEAGQ